MWLMEAKKPVEVYARSVDKALGPEWKGIDGTGYVINVRGRTIYHGAISWALPEVWPPGAVYSSKSVRSGPEVFTIDAHTVTRARREQGPGRRLRAHESRRVDFLTSYPGRRHGPR